MAMRRLYLVRDEKFYLEFDFAGHSWVEDKEDATRIREDTANQFFDAAQKGFPNSTFALVDCETNSLVRSTT